MNMKPFANFAENMMQKSGRKSAAREASHEVGEQMGRSFREDLTPSRAAKAASEKNDFGGYGYGYYQDHATYGNYNQGSAQNSHYSSYGDYNRAHQQSSSGYGGYNQGYQQSAGYGGYNQGYQQSAGYGGYNQGYQQSAGYGGYGSQASVNSGSFGYPGASASSYSAASAGADMADWSRAYAGGDAEALARAMAAEARGLLKNHPDAVQSVAYVLAQEAKKSGMSIEDVVKYKYPKGGYLLQSFGEGSKGVNGMYYDEHKMPTSKIENWNKFLQIANDAIAGKEPTGIKPNHFYDTSISAPKWAQGKGVKKVPIGNMVFVHNPESMNTPLPKKR